MVSHEIVLGRIGVQRSSQLLFW